MQLHALKRPLKEIIITYQADKLTPITFQNIIQKDLKAKSTGQEPSFLPQKFIYDPGVIIGDINKHVEASEILSNHGYILNSIIVLSDLYHQYREFNFIN